MKTNDTPSATTPRRPPIVTVLGHVDHGKTSLLDFIRKTNITAREHGGITQHIGAYQSKVTSSKGRGKSEERYITFIDTPGHEAFIKMRSRGAQVADIVVLVVAADDSVKPQTLESIRVIQAAKVPLIVALNKIDLPAANGEKVKKDLAKAGVQVEGFGGDVPLVPISAKTGTGVSELLDMILLVADMNDIPKVTGGGTRGVVIETRLDKGKGMVATLVVTEGTITNSVPLYDGTTQVAKVRALFDEFGIAMHDAPAGKPVEVLGFTLLPTIGTTLTVIPVDRVVPQLPMVQKKSAPDALPDFLQPLPTEADKKLSILLKADTAGSLEAIIGSLQERVQVVSSGIGDITDADMLQAKAMGALVIGFQVKCRGSAVKLAQTEKVLFRTYTIIYKLFEELTEVVESFKSDTLSEREIGAGKIIAEFPYENLRVAGTKVITGRLVRGDNVKIMRGETEIGRGKVKSLRVGKEDSGKVQGGSECGVLFDRTLDFALGDGIIAYTTG